MKHLDFYRNKLQIETESEIFQYLMSTLKPSNRRWDYFVDWGSVEGKIKEIEIALNCLNYLIGKEDFDNEFKTLVNKYPNVIEVIPLLVAFRDDGKEFHVLEDRQNNQLIYKGFRFSNTKKSDQDIEKYLYFVEKIGLKEIFQNGKIKNLVDYMFGVEVGISTNARKNRSGKAMENIVEPFIEEACALAGNLEFITEATPKEIKSKFNCNFDSSNAARRFDFFVHNRTTNENHAIEVNFYSSGGSKLKATAGEYVELQNQLSEKGIDFIWITDGIGWKTSSKPLKDAFQANDHIFNLRMLELGVLSEVLGK